MASGQQQQGRSELDRMAREGQTVVPGGTGGKSLEAQENLAEGMQNNTETFDRSNLPFHSVFRLKYVTNMRTCASIDQGAAAGGRRGRSRWGRKGTARWGARAASAPATSPAASAPPARASTSTSPSTRPSPRLHTLLHP